MSRIRTGALGLALWCAVSSAWCAETWRSELYPRDWAPGFQTAAGRFVHDFSYAGYRAGNAPIPSAQGPSHDVVRDFKADNTGREDATAAIQSAIDAAGEAGGGVVWLPAGDYLLRGSLRLDRSGVVLRGEGAERTRLRFVDRDSAVVDHIRIAGRADAPDEYPMVNDAAGLARFVEVEDARGLSAGDDVDLGWVVTEDFVAEHGMAGVWKVHNGKWQAFFRVNVRSVDTTARPHRVELDVPLRYAAKVRDGASLRRRTGYIEECGVEDLALADPMPADAVDGFPRSVRRRLILLLDAKNCWVRNVNTFLPEGEGLDTRHHLYDKGIGVLRGKRITIENCVLRHAQRRDAGGHGYLFEISGGNDVLIKDCEGIGGRHNFTANWYFGNVGNVFLRCVSREGTLSDWNNAWGPSDFHHSLSMATLIDSCVIDDGWMAVNRGSMSGGAGHTATESVFWNCRGTGRILSAQYGWGYLVGLADSLRVLAKVEPDTRSFEAKMFAGTEPLDFVEGTGRGAELEPQSLYEDQLARRLQGPAAMAGAGRTSNEAESEKSAELESPTDAPAGVATETPERSGTWLPVIGAALLAAVVVGWGLSRLKRRSFGTGSRS